MFDPLYINNSPTSYYCYDNTYNNANPYAGYFEENQWYNYDAVSGKFVVTTAPGSGACNNQTGYVCVDINTSGNPHVLNLFKATGKFLNWLSASKFDIEKQVLTGGKYDSGSQNLIGESRGCFGRRFMKEVPASNFSATFAVRGPEPKYCSTAKTTCTTDAGCPGGETCIPNIFAVSTGGQTYIEILSGNFNAAVCQDAIDEAINGSLGQLKKKIDDCLAVVNGSNPTGGQSSVDQNGAFNQSIQSCWHGSPQNWGHQNSLSNMCDKIYPNTSPMDIPLTSRAAVCGYAYIGKCWEDNVPPHSWPSNEQCFQDQMDIWCSSFEFPEVIDPSGTSTDTQQHGNLPGMLLASASESQLGAAVGTFPVKVDSTTPTGLIHEFTDRIRFGIMAFNDNGSKTECDAFPSYNEQRIAFACQEIGAGDKDAAKVLAEIGSDISTVINTTNNLQAKTWTPYAEGFFNAIAYYSQNINTSSPLPYRLNLTDFDTTNNPVQFKCQANNVLMVSDGMSTTDQRRAVNDFVSNYSNYNDPADNQITSGGVSANAIVEPVYFGSKNLDDLAWYAQHKNIFNPTLAIQHTKEIITTYVVYSGIPCTAKDANGNCTSTDETIPERLMQQTALNGGGTYERAENPTQLFDSLKRTFQTISARAASGTAASVLATGEGSGANLVQAIFYPTKTYGGTDVEWTGSLKNLWYYIDPFLGNSSIREDTDEDKTLTLTSDRIINFYFDTVSNLTKANLYIDLNGDGVADTPSTPDASVYFEDIKTIWEAGSKLQSRASTDRVVYTTINGSTRLDFTTSNATTLRPYLQAPNDNLAGRLISYVRGTDYNKFCSSTVATSCTNDSNCPAGETCIQFRNRTVSISGTQYTLKLGDIIDSTPRILSSVPNNTYHKTYKDSTYKEFIETTDYKNRGMVFVGANDGMLHAFRLGKLTLFEEKNKKADITGTDLGKEEWAFIPKNALPYLKYMADPNYCHLYYIDATPVMVDVNISGGPDAPKTAGNWKTILIGGMKLGGACRKTGDSCTGCVKTPILDPTDASKGLGYSSYFALDITDPTNPQVLWEFSDEALGFSTTGPAIVKVSAQTGGVPDISKNGKWFVVLGSGPTGPIDPNTHQFKGYSAQNLKVFVLDLETGQLLRTFDSGINYAFAGSIVNGQIDFDQNDSTKSGYYQDEAVYFGFTKAENNPPVSTTKWNVGGVLRLFTKNSLSPADWALSKVIEGVGPVTAAVAKLQNYADSKAWLFFGTGRYFFKVSDDIDDQNNGRSLYGVREPCYSSSGINETCTSLVTRAQLGNANASKSTDSDGWYIDLDTCTNAAGTEVSCSSANALYKPERNVTDPLATTTGAVFFTTTKPTADVCEFGGSAHLWAVYYDSGGSVSSSKLRGKALMQVSTGSIEEVDLRSAFTEKTDSSTGDGRRSTAVQGVPPAGAPPGILVPPPPVNRIFHIRER